MHALTPREKQIALRLLKFEKRSAIASTLRITVRTVDFHLANLRRKVVANCKEELTLKLYKLNGSLRHP